MWFFTILWIYLLNQKISFSNMNILVKDTFSWKIHFLPSDVLLNIDLLSKHTSSTLVSSVGEESACSAGALGSIPGLGKSPGERNVYPLQYSVLDNSMDCMVHGFTKSWRWLSDFHSLIDKIFQNTWKSD